MFCRRTEQPLAKTGRQEEAGPGEGSEGEEGQAGTQEDREGKKFGRARAFLSLPKSMNL